MRAPFAISGRTLTMARLAEMLAPAVNRVVVDRTGLDGSFDSDLQWITAPSGLPSIFTALQEQLGLRLDPQRGPVEMLLIDHAEKPTEN